MKVMLLHVALSVALLGRCTETPVASSARADATTDPSQPSFIGAQSQAFLGQCFATKEFLDKGEVACALDLTAGHDGAGLDSIVFATGNTCTWLSFDAQSATLNGSAPSEQGTCVLAMTGRRGGSDFPLVISVSFGSLDASDPSTSQESNQNMENTSTLEEFYTDPTTTPPAILGLADDPAPRKMKSWFWNCSQMCQFRYVIDSAANTKPVGEYAYEFGTTLEDGDGPVYLHIQAKNLAGLESPVVHVSAVLDNSSPESPVSTLNFTAPTANNNRPTVGGTLSDGAKLHFYSDSKCNQKISSTAKEEFTAEGATFDVPDNTIFSVYPVAEDAAGNFSACPDLPLQYTEDSDAPDFVGEGTSKLDAIETATGSLIIKPQSDVIDNFSSASTIKFEFCLGDTAQACGDDFVVYGESLPGIPYLEISDPAAKDGKFVASRVVDGAGNRGDVIDAGKIHRLRNPNGGDDVVCIVSAASKLYCAGENYYGLIGKDPAVDGPGSWSTFEEIPGLTGVVKFASGNSTACALISDGSVKCWGDGANLLGNGVNQMTHIPTLVSLANGESATDIQMGWNFACALLSSGGVRCWGYDVIGNGSASSGTPAAVTGITTALEISAGIEHACARLADSTIRCWGKNYQGALGNGTTTNSSTPVSVTGISTAKAVRAMHHHTCAILQDDSLKCWGNNSNGKLGDGTTNNRSTPVVATSFTALGSISDVAGNESVTCAVISGQMQCIGDASYPAPPTLTNIAKISRIGSYRGFCGMDSSGYASCWGGIEPLEVEAVEFPVRPSGLSNVDQIRAGEYFSCARLKDGSPLCWGDNAYGQTGTGETSLYVAVPKPVLNLGTVLDINVGVSFACAIVTGGTVKCWGNNSNGQLGNGTTTNSAMPVSVSGLSGAKKLALNRYAACALLDSGAIKCWGSGADSRNFDTSGFQDTAIPVVVSGVSTATDIAANSESFCAILKDSSVKCWGRNYSGNLGNGSTSDAGNPVRVNGLTGVTKLGSGAAYNGTMCAITKDHSLYCWGYNSYNQLLDGSHSNVNVPVRILGVDTAKDVTATDSGMCAVLLDGTAKCWGYYTAYGEFGISASNLSGYDVSTPTAIPGLGDISAISGVYDNTCVLHSSGDVSCFGYSGYGQIGIGFVSGQPNSMIHRIGLVK